MNIVQRGPTPNGTLGALPSSAIRYYVAHTCEGGFEGSVAWLLSEDSLVSAHVVIREDGLIAQLAAWDDVCWHAGITFAPSTPLYVPGVNPNRVSRGLEFAGWAVRPLTPEQIAAGVELIRFWRALDGWAVPLVPHSALATGGPNVRSDPGAANLAALEAALEDDVAITGDQAKDIVREMLTSDEGAVLVRAAIIHPGGYGAALETELQVLRDAVAAAGEPLDENALLTAAVKAVSDKLAK